MVEYRRSQDDFMPMKDEVDNNQYESVLATIFMLWIHQKQRISDAAAGRKS